MKATLSNTAGLMLGFVVSNLSNNDKAALIFSIGNSPIAFDNSFPFLRDDGSIDFIVFDLVPTEQRLSKDSFPAEIIKPKS